MQIQGQNFVVTGAASGLGAATVAMLHENGANVASLDLAPVQFAQADDAGQSRHISVQVNVTEESAVLDALSKVLRQFGAIHGLVNCAGIAPAQKVVSRNGAHSLELFNKVIAVNLSGTFNVVRIVAEQMRLQSEIGEERGVIINTASVAAFDGQIGQVAYAASKAGVAGMTLPLARDLAKDKIRVMAIAPGIFATPMLLAMPKEVQDSLGASVPFPPRLGQPSEYAALVQHIIENTMLNGEVIRLDGAIRMAPR